MKQPQKKLDIKRVINLAGTILSLILIYFAIENSNLFLLIYFWIPAAIALILTNK